jgi:hypothetical protein
VTGARQAGRRGGALAAAVLPFFATAAQAQSLDLETFGVEAPPELVQGATVRVRLALEAEGGPVSASYAVLLTTGVRDGARELGRFGPVALAAGTPRRLEADVTLPPGLTGVRTLAVEVDPANAIAEANENDNVAFAPRESLILPPRSELQARGATLSASRAAPGARLDVRFTLENDGASGASVPVSVVVGRDRVPTRADRELARAPLTVAAGAMREARVPVTLPADLAAGRWWVGILVDPDGALGRPDRRADPASLVVVTPDLALRTRNLPDAVLGRTYAIRLEARGGDGDHRFTLDGALPDGLAYDPGSQVISGTPVRTGRFPLRVRVRSAGLEDAAELELRVQSTGRPLQIETATLAVGYVTRPYAHALAAGGGEPPYTWSVSQGVLPAGLRLDPSGRIEGIPERLGRSDLQLAVADAQGARRTADAVLLVDLLPEVLIQTRQVDARVGAPVDVTFTAIGGVRPLRWEAGTAPPPGLSLDAEGRLRGTPARVGRFPFQVIATDASRPGVQDVAFVEVRVSDEGALRITSGPAPPIEGVSVYEHVLTAEGGTPPYRWSLVPGDAIAQGFFLAPGPERGAPEGTAVVYGRGFAGLVSAFTVQVEDAYGRRDEQALVLRDAPTDLGGSGGGGCRGAGREPAGSDPWIVLAALAGAGAWRRGRRAEPSPGVDPER